MHSELTCEYSVGFQIVDIVVVREPTDNNNIMLLCNLNSVTISGATFYRRNGDSETLLNSNTFTINKITEGFYFCKKDDSRSNEQPINGK